MSFVSISPVSLIMTAIKKAESGEALIVRYYNASDSEVTGKLELFQAIQRAESTNLNEEPLEEIPLVSENGVSVEARPWEVKTIKFTFYTKYALGIDPQATEC
ncbi:MAG: hypothetical protein GY801_53715 [bacterium]|nr:hypothetical protein [bacterium]